MTDNDEVELIPYGGFRESDFNAIVSDISIKEFGENKIPMLSIEFEDGGAPVNYFVLDYTTGLPLIQQTDKGNIKSFNDVGNFASVCQKAGLKAFMSINNKTARTEPSIIGMKTHWKVTPYTKTKDGNTKSGFNVRIAKIDVNPSATPQATPETTPTDTPKPTGITPEQVEEWKTLLMDVLDTPKNEIQIWTAVKSKVPEDKHSALGLTRKKSLESLKESGFLRIDEDNKYEIVM